MHNNINELSTTFNFREEVDKYLKHWKWIVFSLGLAVFIGSLYLRYTTPIYKASTTILLKDKESSGFSDELSAFSDLDIGGQSNKIGNVIEVLKSREIIGNVVDTLKLNVLYFSVGTFKEIEIFNPNFNIRFITPKKQTTFNIKIIDNNFYEIIDELNNITIRKKFNEKVYLNKNIFIVNKKITTTNNLSQIYKIQIVDKDVLVRSLKEKLKIKLTSGNSSVLKISIDSPLRLKAINFLNELVKQYNSDAIVDKNVISIKTHDFINSRLVKIGLELSDLEDQSRNYKSNNKYIGLDKESELILENLSKNNSKIAEVLTKLNVSEWTLNYLKNETDNTQILPSLGIDEQFISKSIEVYNDIVQKRNSLKLNAGIENPSLKFIDTQLKQHSIALKKSLENFISALKLSLKQLKKESSKISKEVSSMPQKERGFVDIARKLEISSTLYSYLLKKKEENSIAMAVAVENAKIIDYAYCYRTPVFPKKSIVIVISALFGLLIPLGLIYVIDLLDNKIHDIEELKKLVPLPFLGDVPKSDSKLKLVVKKGENTSIAESFRLIRTNLNFMFSSSTKNEECKTVFVSSTTSGEGKSFVSINLASSLAISGKKTLLIGMDLRAPKVTQYLNEINKEGVTNYLTRNDLNLNDIKFKIDEIDGLDIIPSGVIPPNPSELLLSKKVEEMFAELKKDYDYIVVDTAPVNLVTDTLLISKYSDLFVYVVRANYLDKRQLIVPNNLTKDNKIKNMALVLNGSDANKSYGYGQYGYGVNKTPWYKKILKK